MMKPRLIPSVLTYSADEFKERLQAVTPHVQSVQLDVLDKSWIAYENFHDAEVIDKLSPQINFEVHLMVADPARAIASWHFDWVEKIIFHLETVPDASPLIAKIKLSGKKAGVAISPGTPIDLALPLVSEIDTLLVMTVEPGRNGSEFIPAALVKVAQARKQSPFLNIEVDGGVSPATARDCVEAGANLLVVGSYLTNKNFAGRLLELTSAIS